MCTVYCRVFTTRWVCVAGLTTWQGGRWLDEMLEYHEVVWPEMLEAQVQPPASTTSTRIEEGFRKRRRVPNKLYMNN